ncbi:hypothetical protein NDU88_002000 [Pleurodeles waltl]|uniref:Uncharacterized protein n=1 Tax=Pleurodeles waltl TaxID=8319 RepID=A0AAV7MP94_PLEWA|nr:hypothetical protein NDU88_002000 [Pleurodeles waltl]
MGMPTTAAVEDPGDELRCLIVCEGRKWWELWLAEFTRVDGPQHYRHRLRLFEKAMRSETEPPGLATDGHNSRHWPRTCL